MSNAHILTDIIIFVVVVLLLWRRVHRLKKIKETYEVSIRSLIILPILYIALSGLNLYRLSQLQPEHFYSFGGLWLLFFIIFLALGALLVKKDDVKHLPDSNKLAVPGSRMRLIIIGVLIYGLSMFIVSMFDQSMMTNHYYQMVSIFIRAMISGFFTGMFARYYLKFHSIR